MKSSGFTLVELLITLAVAIILATVAVPGFHNMMVSNLLAADYNEVLSGLNYARSEAIKRREEVTFEVVENSPWKYHIYRSENPKKPLLIRSGKSQQVSLTGAGLVKFNSLGRIVDGSACFDGCGLSVVNSSLLGCRVVEISRFGRIARSECDEEAA